MKEVEMGRYAVLFKTIPYKNYVQSPIGLVPKHGGKTRLIFHLSYDFKNNKLINTCMPNHLCKVKYKDLDHAVRTCLQMKRIWDKM